MTIAITGATGQLGRLVVQKLKHQVSPYDIFALARTPESAKDLGVQVRLVDYDRPTTLGPALTGIDILLLISGPVPGARVAQHRNVIGAAKVAGVKRLAYTSALHADTSPLDVAVDHHATEADLKASGLAYTLLRHGWYTENYNNSIAGALAGGALLGSARDGRIASAARADYAEGAARVLVERKHEGRTYELAGDHAWTMSDLAAEISRYAGRTIPYRDLPPDEYAAVLTSHGVAEPLAHAIVGWDVAAAEGALFDDSGQLSRLIGRPTTPLSASVAEALRDLPCSVSPRNSSD